MASVRIAPCSLRRALAVLAVAAGTWTAAAEGQPTGGGAPTPYERIPPGQRLPDEMPPGTGPALVPGQPHLSAGQPAMPTAEPAAEETILDVQPVGLEALSYEEFMRQIHSRPGRIFSLATVEEDVRRLNATKRFLDVKTLYERPPEGGIVVIFQLVERPTVGFVRYVGNVKIKARKLTEKTGINVGDPLDPYSVEEGRRKIEDYYREKGYSRVQVTIVEGNRRDDRGVEYLINEGQRQRIRTVAFVGNTITGGSRLKTQIQSKPPLFFVWKGFVDQQKIDGDVDRLTAYYRSLGFFRARIGREMQLDEKQKWLTLTFVIDEGPRYTIRNVSFVGQEKFTSDRWSSELELTGGQYFDQAKLAADTRLVQDFYGSKGYVFADVKPDPRFLEDGPGQLDLVYQIDEGARYRIGRVDVKIVGQAGVIGDRPHTKITTVLNRMQGLRPGDVVDTRKIRDAERQLKRSGLFLYDPQQGVEPKITLAPRDENALFASGDNSFRGQSPDADERVLDVVIAEGQPSEAAAADGPMDAIEWRPPRGSAENASRDRPPAASRGANGARPGAAGDRPLIRGQYASGAEPLPQYDPPPPRGGQFRRAQVVQQPTPAEDAEFAADGGAAIAGDDFEQLPPEDFQPFQDALEEEEPIIDILGEVQETQTGKLLFGVGVNSDAGLVGSIVLDEQNFDITRWPTGWEDIRTATAFRGAGQQFRIEAVPGTQVQRYVINFREPYLFNTPVSFGVSGFFFDRRYRDWDEQRFGGRISLGYQFTPSLSGSVSLRGEKVKVHDPEVPTPPELLEVLGDNDLYSVKVQLNHDTRDSAFLPTEGHTIELAFEQAFGSFDFPVATAEARQYFLVHERPDRSGRHVFSVGGRVGFAGTDTPLFEHFFAGGFSTLRGFDFRGASPQKLGVRVGGEFTFLGSVEYTFPLTGDDVLRAVAFCDFGTVEERPRLDADTFRVAPGIGLRISVAALGPAPIALDLAVPVMHADGDDIENFSFFVGLLR